MALLVPWDYWEYPGRNRWLAGVLGLSWETARQYTTGRNELPAKHMLRLADYASDIARQLEEVAQDLRSVGAERNTKRRRERLIGLQKAYTARRLNRVRGVRESLDAGTSDAV